MKNVIAFLLLSILMLFAFFQPGLSQAYHVQQEIVKTVLSDAAMKAAVQGRFTDEIILEMKQEIHKKLNYDVNEIVFEGTTEVVPRGGIIEGTLKLPAYRSFMFPGFLTADDGRLPISYTVQRMSEYVENNLKTPERFDRPVAQFSISPSGTVQAGNTVTVTDESGDVLQRKWKIVYPDGYVLNESSESVSFEAESGRFEISLWVRDGTGLWSQEKKQTLLVQ